MTACLGQRSSQTQGAINIVLDLLAKFFYIFKMFLFAQEPYEAYLQYLIVQITLERGDMYLDQTFLVDIDKRGGIVHRRGVY